MYVHARSGWSASRSTVPSAQNVNPKTDASLNYQSRECVVAQCWSLVQSVTLDLCVDIRVCYYHRLPTNRRSDQVTHSVNEHHTVPASAAGKCHIVEKVNVASRSLSRHVSSAMAGALQTMSLLRNKLRSKLTSVNRRRSVQSRGIFRLRRSARWRQREVRPPMNIHRNPVVVIVHRPLTSSFNKKTTDRS